MSLVAAQLVARVSIEDADKAKQQLADVGQKADETSKGFAGMLKGALSVAGGIEIFHMVGDAVDFLRDQLTDVISVAMKHEQIQAQTVLQNQKEDARFSLRWLYKGC